MGVWRIFAIVLAWGAVSAAQVSADPQLVAGGGLQASLGVPVFVPLDLVQNGHDVTALVFSLDLDLERVVFDAADGDDDGIPDGVGFPLGMPEMVVVTFDATDEDGELDVLLLNLSGLPLLDGLLLEVELLPAADGLTAGWIGCSTDPPASFGDAGGQDVPGACVVTGSELFADGFESGDLGAWSSSPP